MALSRRFDDALALAAELHRGQVRKGTRVPYLAHLLGVAAIALEHGASEEQAIAALLHDAVEDQGGTPTLDMIRSRFGDAVADIVNGCSDSVALPKPPWRARKEAYVAHLARAPEAVCLVSAADKLHNARSILADYRVLGEGLWERFTGGREGTLWYYRSLLEALEGRVGEDLHQELTRVVVELLDLSDAPGGTATNDAGAQGDECACLDPECWNDVFEKTPLGVDETAGRSGDVSLLGCRECGRTWLHYFVEYQTIPESGRWYRGLIGPVAAGAVTARNAVEILAGLPWRFQGGAHFGSAGGTSSGPLEL